jgi:acyl transferase domain-containing protein/3-hydroxymyristoyl/3-hydroxydecanoyl-(acyl carrier protein) dehydratase
MSKNSERVAIVSAAGRFPGADADLDLYWKNIVAARDCSREVPPERWVLPPERCTDPRVANPDTVYSIRGYYLEPFTPDLAGLVIDPALVARLDPLFQLVLDVGNRAWRSARTDRIDRARVGVVLGNICLPTDRSSDLCRDVLGEKLGLPGSGTHPLNRHVAGLPAGLLARGLSLGGGSYTLDAACASSLYALKLAADELLAGRADAMLAGGCSRPDCQYTQMGFAQLRALSLSGRCSPFDTSADGLMVGEGAGIFVLKRLSDALKQGDTVHAVIAGAGLSNDMHGNLLAPAKEGQLRAMKRAYALAGWQPQDVELIECHATGTPVGDAVEFESLRELWGESGWTAGQCAIGSVKSTVGHLLTGAGAAAVMKVLLAMKAELLPPQANFAAPGQGLRYAGGPFRVLSKPERWNRRSALESRRAAVSGFGFGGVNAHLLLEEWTGLPTRRTAAKPGADAARLVTTRKGEVFEPEAHAPREAVPIAIVGIAAHFGPWDDLRKFQEHVLAGDGTPEPRVNGWGLAGKPSPPGHYIEELRLPTDRFRIPPRELEETLPQQLLMLQVAAAALDDATPGGRESGEADQPTMGAIIGLGLDPNTTNFHLRWSCVAHGLSELPGPPLSANRTMGALGSIAASRIARTFHLGGPSHTVCSEEGSSARAVELGVRALQAEELDRVLVGGVDFAGDPRSVLPGNIQRPGEGAAAFVLERLPDAMRAGRRIHAVIRGVGVAGDENTAIRRAMIEAGEAFDSAVTFQASGNVGDAGAASGAASLAKACIALWQEILPGEGDHPPRFWLHDRATGPRRAAVTSSGIDGTHFAILLEEHVSKAEHAPTIERSQPLGAREEAVFVASGNAPGEVAAALKRLDAFAAAAPVRNIETLARGWFREAPPSASHKYAASLVARSVEELREQIAFSTENLEAAPTKPLPPNARPAIRDRVFYSPTPLGANARIAYVFPGSGNQFDGMGRDLSGQWPQVLRRQQSENQLLRSQFAPDHFWDGDANRAPARDLMFGQVTVGSLVSDIIAFLGVRCDAMIGLSLGESAGLFGVRAWQKRDEMYRRMQASTLFVSDLAPPYSAARLHWGTPEGVPLDWVCGLIPASAEDIIVALRPGLHAYLLIVNTPGECVIGGERADVEKLAAAVGKPVTLLTGVTLAHCEAGQPVEVPYRELHTLPVTPPRGITIYSGAWGRSYKPSDRLCAESITAGLLNTIDVPAVVEAAYRDGVRVFIEVGPGGSCVRMLDSILGDRPHLARAAHVGKQDAAAQILRLVAHLAAERVPVDLGALYGGESACVAHRPPAARSVNEIVIPVGRPPLPESDLPPLPAPAVPPAPRGVPSPTPMPVRQAEVERRPEPLAPVSVPNPGFAWLAPAIVPAIEASANVQVLTMQAQETFLRVSQKYTETAAGLIRFQTALLERWAASGEPLSLADLPARLPETPVGPPRALNYEQCCVYAVGRIGDVLGPLFAEIDAFPTRVRLPDGPLQLVDRITLIEGEPLSMSQGRVVTEHTVRPDRWYLESGRIPTALAVESGQADLFLSGFLGIDLQTRGLAVYRLLDAVVSFHRGLPRVGDTIVYDIHIDEFVKQGDSWLFRFWFDGTVNGEPFITMRNGVAGFFTAEALAAGKGIVQTALDRKRMPGKRPADWRDLVPQHECSLDARQVEALRGGDLVAAFGTEFAGLGLHHPATIPGGMLRLVDRVPLIDPVGGRFGLGFVRAEFDIHPDDWFLTCHFVDDMVMPGTLMYECCLHTLRILLMRLGWVGEADEVVCEPLPGVNSRLKCRGQVTASTRTVTYEVTVKEQGYRPEPYCIADALMYADGKPIVEITNMTLRMSGLTRERLEAIWAKPISALVEPEAGGAGKPRPVLYDSRSIMAYSNGKPSEAFGEPYRIFDQDRVIARLPGPPFQFLDRVVDVTGKPFVLQAGAACETEYDVPADAWYFSANRCENMPFAVLLEIALQPCGWLAAYCGSALTSPEDLSFRNLGGKATQLRPVTPDTGTLTAFTKMTSVSSSAGMIIQHYEMRVRDRVGDVYRGTTYFGFFSKPALANQVGIREARLPVPAEADLEHAERDMLPHSAPFPEPMLRMVDRIETYLPHGGKKGLGLVVGKIAVDPEFWFFKAHFFQDPVWPGSLGLESFLQLMKYFAWRRWGEVPGRAWQTVAIDAPHTWVYRGQVLPGDQEVTVYLEVTAIDDEKRRITTGGFLTVDGRVIYQMTDFTLEL